MNTLLKTPLTTAMLVTCCFASQEFPFDIPIDKEGRLTVEHTNHDFTGVINLKNNTSTLQIDNDCNLKILGTAIILGTADDEGKIVLDGTITLYKDNKNPPALQNNIPNDIVSGDDEELREFSLNSIPTCPDTKRLRDNPNLEEGLRPYNEATNGNTLGVALPSGYRYDNSSLSIENPATYSYLPGIDMPRDNMGNAIGGIPPLNLATLTSNAPPQWQNGNYFDEEYGQYEEQYEDQAGYYNDGIDYNFGFAEVETINNMGENDYQEFFMNPDPYYHSTADLTLPVQVLPVEILPPIILPVKVLPPTQG